MDVILNHSVCLQNTCICNRNRLVGVSKHITSTLVSSETLGGIYHGIRRAGRTPLPVLAITLTVRRNACPCCKSIISPLILFSTMSTRASSETTPYTSRIQMTVTFGDNIFHRATLCWRGMCYGPVLSLCPSVTSQRL